MRILIAVTGLPTGTTNATVTRSTTGNAVGPLTTTLSISPDVNDPGFREVDFDTMKAVYREQIHALVEGGVEGGDHRPHPGPVVVPAQVGHVATHSGVVTVGTPTRRRRCRDRWRRTAR